MGSNPARVIACGFFFHRARESTEYTVLNTHRFKGKTKTKCLEEHIDANKCNFLKIYLDQCCLKFCMVWIVGKPAGSKLVDTNSFG